MSSSAITGTSKIAELSLEAATRAGRAIDPCSPEKNKDRVAAQPKRLAVGDKIAERLIDNSDKPIVLSKLSYNGKDRVVTPVNLGEELSKGLQVLDLYPGVDTPVCSQEHLPSAIKASELLKRIGIPTTAMSCNDMDVVYGYQQKLDPNGNVNFLGDWQGQATFAMGTGTYVEGRNLGFRSIRGAVLLDDGVVAHAFFESSGACTRSNGWDFVIEVIKYVAYKTNSKVGDPLELKSATKV